MLQTSGVSACVAGEIKNMAEAANIGTNSR
jgi:hypothetical protein